MGLYISSPIGSMYGIYANIGGILMVNVTIYSIHGSYGSGEIIVIHQSEKQSHVGILPPACWHLWWRRDFVLIFHHNIYIYNYIYNI